MMLRVNNDACTLELILTAVPGCIAAVHATAILQV